MEHETRRNFDVTKCVSISPISKSSIKQISRILEKHAKVKMGKVELIDTITISYVTSKSSYSFIEFDANYPSDSRYTGLAVSIRTLNSSLDIGFIIEPSVGCLVVSSSTFTKVQLDDLADALVLEIDPIMKGATPLQPTITNLESDLDYVVEKALSLPDENGTIHSPLYPDAQGKIGTAAKIQSKTTVKPKKMPIKNIFAIIGSVLAAIAALVTIIEFF